MGRGSKPAPRKAAERRTDLESPQAPDFFNQHLELLRIVTIPNHSDNSPYTRAFLPLNRILLSRAHPA